MAFDKKIMFGFLFLCFFSCSKIDSDENEMLKTFRTSSWEIEIPQSYSVDSSYHWDRGCSYFIKDSMQQILITTHEGLETDNSLFEKHIYSNDKFSINNRIDTTIYWEGKKYKKRIIVLQESNIKEFHINGKSEKHYFPHMLQFDCFLDYISPQTCEKIIFSIKKI